MCRKIHADNEGFTEDQRLYFYRVKSSAKKRKIPFELKMKDIYSILEKQNYKCALTNLPIIVLGKEHTASLDRKNSSLSYSRNNIHWVHKNINKMKGGFSMEYFLDLCRKVNEHSQNKENENRNIPKQDTTIT